jgi:hypothetical protein
MRLKNQNNVLILLIIITLLFSCYIIADDSFAEAGWRRRDGGDESTTPSEDETTTQPEEEEEKENKEEKDGKKESESKVNASKITIGTLIGLISLLIGKGLNSIPTLKKEDKIVLDRVPDDQIMLAGDLSTLPPKIKDEILKQIRKKIDKQKKNGFTKIYKKKLNEFTKLKKSPYFDDAIQLLRKEGYKPGDIEQWEIEEAIQRIKEQHDKLKDKKMCRHCRKPVKAIRLQTREDQSIGKWYTHTTPGGSQHKWFVSHHDDKDAYTQWRERNDLPTSYTHCRCGYCFTVHRRDQLEKNPWYERWFSTQKFKCKKCRNWQKIPKAGTIEDNTVAIFERD